MFCVYITQHQRYDPGQHKHVMCELLCTLFRIVTMADTMNYENWTLPMLKAELRKRNRKGLILKMNILAFFRDRVTL